MPDPFLPPDEQRLYDSIVHGLRSQGWTRSDAESEAIDRVIIRRDRLLQDALPKGTPDA